MLTGYLLTLLTVVLVHSAPHKLPHLDDQGQLDVATFQKYVLVPQKKYLLRQQLLLLLRMVFLILLTVR